MSANTEVLSEVPLTAAPTAVQSSSFCADPCGPDRRFRKAIFDIGLALSLLILTAPLMLLAAIITRLTSRGPAFYSQVRLGRGGIPYRIYKIRTMTNNCERDSGATWSTPGDKRITWFGSFLRKTHLDELPQLWNVLRGDMSLVGPRPERPEFIPQLTQLLPLYTVRLDVLPGVTGLAQVQLPADTDLNSVRRKLAYDLYYVRKGGFWLDLRIIAGTAFGVVGVPGRISCKLLRLPGGEGVENGYERAAATMNQCAEITALLQPA